jgi:hypothetical protein
MFEGAGLWGRVDSRLLIVRGGNTWVERLGAIVPDTYYFLWKEPIPLTFQVPCRSVDLAGYGPAIELNIA